MKTLKHIFLLLLFTTASHIKAQFDDMYYLSRPDTGMYTRSQVALFGDYIINSTAFTSQFFNKFYSGGFIDKELKDKVANRLAGDNVAGADFNYGISGMIRGKNKKYAYTFALKDRSHFNALFSDDFFRTAMYGNKDYAGKTAELGSLMVNLIRYQQLQLGFVWTGPDSSKTRMGIAASMVKGEQNFYINAPELQLFTSADGRYIDFTSQMQFMQTDTAKRGFGAWNGMGASFDLFFEVPLKNDFGYSAIRVSFNDVGFINWSNQSIHAQNDSTYHYEGYYISSLFDIQDSTFNTVDQDSLINELLDIKKQKYTTNLPSIFNLNYRTWFSKKVGLNAGVRYLNNANYTINFYVQPIYRVRSNMFLSLSASYGGYGRFSYGVNASAEFKKGIIFMAGSNNLEGYISPKNSLGQNVFIKLIKTF